MSEASAQLLAYRTNIPFGPLTIRALIMLDDNLLADDSIETWEQLGPEIVGATGLLLLPTSNGPVAAIALDDEHLGDEWATAAICVAAEKLGRHPVISDATMVQSPYVSISAIITADTPEGRAEQISDLLDVVFGKMHPNDEHG